MPAPSVPFPLHAEVVNGYQASRVARLGWPRNRDPPRALFTARRKPTRRFGPHLDRHPKRRIARTPRRWDAVASPDATARPPFLGPGQGRRGARCVARVALSTGPDCPPSPPE